LGLAAGLSTLAQNSVREARVINEKVLTFVFQSGIIVRDKDARERLHEQMGKFSLVFTLVDSKGLEFDDVRSCSCLSYRSYLDCRSYFWTSFKVPDGGS
jgi:hypothetical protein